MMEMNLHLSRQPFSPSGADTSSRLDGEGRAEQANDTFGVDDKGRQQVLRQRSQAATIATAPPCVPTNHLPEFPLDPWMDLTHFLICVGLRALTRTPVFRLVVVLRHASWARVAWFQTLLAQRTVAALLNAELEAPGSALFRPRARPCRLPLGAAQFIARFVQCEVAGLKQPRRFLRPILWRCVDTHLRPFRIVFQGAQRRAAKADAIERDTLNLVALSGFFFLQERHGVGSFVAVARQQVDRTDQFGIRVQTGVNQVTVKIIAVLAVARITVSERDEFVARLRLSVGQDLVRQRQGHPQRLPLGWRPDWLLSFGSGLQAKLQAVGPSDDLAQVYDSRQQTFFVFQIGARRPDCRRRFLVRRSLLRRKHPRR